MSGNNFNEKLSKERMERILADNENSIRISNEEANRAESVSNLAIKHFEEKADTVEEISNLKLRVNKLENGHTTPIVNKKPIEIDLKENKNLDTTSPYKKVAIITFKTESYANNNVSRNTNLEETNEDGIWKRTQVRNLTNINGFNQEGKNLNLKSEKAKLVTSLTGNNGINSPEYQTGRYTLYFDDFTSITFKSGFKSNYGFGTYKYTGTVHGMGKYKVAEIEWTSLQSGWAGTDDWVVRIIEPNKEKLVDDEITMELETESYSNTNVITNQTKYLGVKYQSSAGSAGAAGAPVAGASAAAGLAGLGIAGVAVAVAAAVVVPVVVAEEEEPKPEKVWRKTQVRNISNIKKINLDSSKAKLLTSLTGNNGDKSPEYQTGRYILYFDDFRSITFTTGFKSNYDFGIYEYIGLVHGMGEYKTARIQWTSLKAGESGTDKWKIILSKSIHDLDSELKPSHIITFKTDSYNNSNIISNDEKDDNDSESKIWKRSQIRNISNLNNDNKNIDENFSSFTPKLLTYLSGNKGSKNPEYQSGRYILYLDDLTSITFTTAFRSDYGFGIYKYTGIVNGMDKYKLAEISWKSEASGVDGTDEWEIRLIESDDIKSTANMAFETESYANKNLITNTIENENMLIKSQIRDITKIVPLNKNSKKLNIDSKKAKLLTSLTGNGKSTEYQTGRYVLYITDFISITFNTGFDSNYGFGVYKYVGQVHGIDKYKTAKIAWTSLASGEDGKDSWEIILE